MPALPPDEIHEQAMVNYKLFFIEDAQLRQVVPFQANNDGVAKRYVQQRRFKRPCELWQADRLVARFRDEREWAPPVAERPEVRLS
jgi:hypothetical protein